MICSSVNRLRFIVWSFLRGQTPLQTGLNLGGNVTGMMPGKELEDWRKYDNEVADAWGNRAEYRDTWLNQDGVAKLAIMTKMESSALR